MKLSIHRLPFFFLFLLTTLGFCTPEKTVADSMRNHLPEGSVSASIHKPQLDSSKTKGKKAVHIYLDEEVDQGMAAYVKRAIAEAEKQKPDYIIFEINTFGGRLDAAFEIVDTITAIRDALTIALVDKKAISAGALIALSCNFLYMKPSTTIGDCAPIVQSQEGPVMLGEKIQSPLRAKFRNLAQRNGYPELLAEAMVTPELEIVQVTKNDSTYFMQAHQYEELTDKEKEYWGPKRTVVREGELLTLTDEEAMDWGFSSGTVENLPELESTLQITSTAKVDISVAENIGRFLAAISPLLMLIGFGLLYMEFQTPGFGMLGIGGIALLAIVFLGQYVSGLTDKLPLVLLIAGALLIVVEVVLLPGTFIAGLLGIGLMAAALILQLKDTDIPVFDPMMPNVSGLTQALIYVLGIAVIALSFPILSSRYLLPLLPEGISPMLKTTLETAASPVEDGTQALALGTRGIARTQLRPAGKVRFGEHLVDAQARDEFIEAGAEVEVVKSESAHVIVIRARNLNKGQA